MNTIGRFERERIMPKLPKQCPACSADLAITRLTCAECGTEVTGHFPPDPFSRLSPNDYDFVVLFVKAKGNIKEMERELGISYWTIRSKLNEIVTQLGFEPGETGPEELASQRQEILEQLNTGQLSVQDAAELLEQLKGKRRGKGRD
jgi:hypothetical protein